MVLFFYIFATLLIASSLMVINSRNPVHAVLWLIVVFCNAAGLMVLMGAEFLAMMLIIVYVGAIAVLFLFVVMMLDIKVSELKGGGKMSLYALSLMGLFLFIDLSIAISLGAKIEAPLSKYAFAIDPALGNAHAIGRVLYTDFILPFQTAGVILFVAMVASIVLTLRSRSGVKRQKASEQLDRTKKNSLALAKHDGKKGLENLNYE